MASLSQLCYEGVMFYFDHAASSRLYPEVIEILSTRYQDSYGNPGAAHLYGVSLRKKIEELRLNFLQKFFKSEGDFLVTSSATLANNVAILAPMTAAHEASKGEVIYFEGDHPSVVKPILELEKRGWTLKPITLDEHKIMELDSVLDLITEKTKLLVLTSVNNQSGQLFPVKEIALQARLKNPNLLIHLDASQSFAKFSEEYNLFDSVTVSSHKMGGPKSVAGLLIKNPKLYQPIFFGGGQQGGLYSGTEDIVLLEAFHKAAELSFMQQSESLEKIKKMNEELRSTLEGFDLGFEFPFPNSSPYILTFLTKAIPSDVFLRLCENKNIFLSSTAACSSRIKGFNPTFKHLGLEEKWHKHVVRLSFSSQTSESEFQGLITGLTSVIQENSFLFKKNKR